MDERLSSRGERAWREAATMAGATLCISLVWLAFYVFLLGHGLMAPKPAASATASLTHASILLSADRKDAPPGTRAR